MAQATPREKRAANGCKFADTAYMRKMDREKHQRLRELIENGSSCREAAAAIGVSAATAIRWTRRAGLKSASDRRLSNEARSAIADALRSGATCAEAAARFGVSDRTAARIADDAEIDRKRSEERARLMAALREGLSRRQAAAVAGVSASTAIRWAREAGTPHGRFVARSPRARRVDPERLAARERLLAAVASGLSRRKAAALLDVPVATAIRWARAPGARQAPDPAARGNFNIQRMFSLGATTLPPRTAGRVAFRRRERSSMRTITCILAAVGLTASAFSATALPIAANPMGGADSLVTHVIQGCGPNGFRGPGGHCRPRFSCPPGWHPGPEGFHCFPNRRVYY